MAATRASGTTAVRYGTMRENVLGADGRARRRPRHHDRHAGAQVVGRLRSHAAVRRIRGHARRHHRGDAPAASAAGSGFRGGLLVRLDQRRGRHRHRHDSARRAGRAHRAARRRRRWTPSIATRRPATRSRRRCSSNSTATASGTSPIRPRPCRRWPPSAAAAASSGPRGSRIASGCGRRATTRYYAALALRPGCARVDDRRLRPDLAARRLHHRDASTTTRTRRSRCCLVGHAGDGNFHLIYLLDPASADELAEARRLNERMVVRALAMGGTCTGEHGVGFGKMKFLEAEHGAALDVMRDDQTRARPRQPDESRQGRGRITLLTSATHFDKPN